jgi:integrase
MKPVSWWDQEYHDPVHIRLFQLLYPEVTGKMPTSCDYKSMREYINLIFPEWLSCYDSSFRHADFIRKAFARCSGRMIEWDVKRDIMPFRKLTDFELKQLFAYREGHVINIMIKLIYSTGVRLGEVLNANIEDLSDSCKIMLVGSREHDALRWIPIAHPIRYAFQRDRSVRNPEDPVFSLTCTASGYPKPVAKISVHKFLRKCASVSGFGLIGIQNIRNTHILNMLQYGVTVEELSRRMGIKKISFFKPYQEMVRRMDRKLPDMLRLLEK